LPSLVTGTLLLLAACAPAAQPSPTAAPAKPAATTAPAKPTEAPAAKPAEAKPAASPTAAAKPAEAKPAASPAAKPAEAKPAASPAAKPEDIRVPKPSGNLNIKIGYSSQLQFIYLPTYMTAERLNKEGWNIQHVHFTATELNSEAAAKGEVQLADGASNSALLATQQGQPVHMLAEYTINDWVVVSKTELKTCADLNGKRVAYHSEGAVSTAMLKVWVKNECNGSPNYLVISGSTNRANAMLSGQIDATVLFLSDFVSINQQAPGKFHVQKTFAEGLPDLMANTVLGNPAWLQANRDVAVAFFAEVLKSNRIANANPGLLEETARRLLPEIPADVMKEIVREYVARDIFPPNGGLTQKKVEGTIKFFEEAGQIKPGLTVQQTSNPGILDAAYTIVGRVPNKP
jgi:ABC-type nitrate/sulfonate/bicarbonate transport system substrate-binding protein